MNTIFIIQHAEVIAGILNTIIILSALLVLNYFINGKKTK